MTKYDHWTPLMAFCYERNFKCKNCCEYNYCKQRAVKNDYGISQRKYTAIKTFSTIGLNGYQEALENLQ